MYYFNDTQLHHRILSQRNQDPVSLLDNGQEDASSDTVENIWISLEGAAQQLGDGDKNPEQASE
jgi:hypothetical protein